MRTKRALGMVFGAMTLGAISLLVARAQGDAQKTYAAKCVSCHGADGSGSAVGKKLGTHDFRSEYTQKLSDEELAAITAKGKNKMPAYEKSLKPEEIKGLVAYIRSLAKSK